VTSNYKIPVRVCSIWIDVLEKLQICIQLSLRNTACATRVNHVVSLE